MQGRDITLSHFLSRIKVDKSNPHEIIPILFDLQEVVQEHIIFTLGLEHKKQELL